MAEEFAMDDLDDEKYDNVVDLHEEHEDTEEDTEESTGETNEESTEETTGETDEESTEETTGDTESTDLEITQQPNTVFRRALLGGYKTVDVDTYIEQTKELLQTTLEENTQLKVKIDELRAGSITIKTALASALKFSENITNSAKREATSLMENAHHAAKRFEQDSQGLGSSLSQEIDALRLQRDRITTELSATLESHIRLLDSIDMNSMTDENRDIANGLLELN